LERIASRSFRLSSNPGASAGRMPANVFVSERAIVTAGFANEVEGVNQ
jgi:hypothetical protein